MTEWRDKHAADIFAQFESRLPEESFAGTSNLVRSLAAGALDGVAKRLRPVLVFLSGSFGCCRPESLISVAIVVELVHTASLLHDDVIDATDTRRGDPALHISSGIRTTTLIGAHLLYTAGRLLQDLKPPNVDIHNQIRAIFAQAATEACAGQFQELLHSNDRAVDEQTYRTIIERKTARLFAVSAEAGALMAGAPRRPLAEYGRLFGVLYQILDDVRDLFEDEQNLDRSPGADLASGVYTLPIILALRKGGRHADSVTDLLRRGRETRCAEDLAVLRHEIIASGALQGTCEHASHVTDQARSTLAELPASAAREAMRDVLDSMVQYLDALVDSAESEVAAACVRM